MGKIVAIASQKGGVGKTTTAINLGASLAILNKKILIVDMDPQGSIAETFQLDEFKIQHGIYDVFVNKIPMSLTITDIGLENYEIVPCHVKNEEEEVELYTAAFNQHFLKTVIEPYKAYYDYILIDCPPNLGTLMINVLVACESVVVPVQCEYYALKSLGKFLKTLKSIGSKHNNNLEIEGILVTMFDKRLKKSREIVEEMAKSFKNLLFQTKIPRNSKIAEAPSVGKPVALYDIGSSGALAYLSLAEEIIKKETNL